MRMKQKKKKIDEKNSKWPIFQNGRFSKSPIHEIFTKKLIAAVINFEATYIICFVIRRELNFCNVYLSMLYFCSGGFKLGVEKSRVEMSFNLTKDR